MTFLQINFDGKLILFNVPLTVEESFPAFLFLQFFLFIFLFGFCRSLLYSCHYCLPFNVLASLFVFEHPLEWWWWWWCWWSLDDGGADVGVPVPPFAAEFAWFSVTVLLLVFAVALFVVLSAEDPVPLPWDWLLPLPAVPLFELVPPTDAMLLLLVLLELVLLLLLDCTEFPWLPPLCWFCWAFCWLSLSCFLNLARLFWNHT